MVLKDKNIEREKKKTMKKNLSLLAVLMMSSALVACDQPVPSTGGEQSSASESVEVKPQEELKFDFTQDVEIELYTTLSADGYGVKFDDYINIFQTLYPNIKVTHSRVGGYDDVRDKLKTELGSGQGPNLAYCYPDHVALYNKARAVQTLDKFIYNEQVDAEGNLLYGLSNDQIDAFIDGYWDEGKSYGDGNMYTLPLYKSTEVLYYNKTVFDAEGLEVPTHWFKDDAGENPETSMEYVCEKLLEKYPNSIPLGYDSEANWFITMCEQLNSPYTSATGNHFLFNNDTNKAFVSKFADMFARGLLTTQEIYGGYTSGLFCNTTDKTSKNSFMSIGSSAGATHQLPDVPDAFEVGIAPIPQANPNNCKVISQGPSLVMFKKTNQQEVMASWLLMRYLTTTLEFQAEMSMSSGYVSCLETVAENEKYAPWLLGAAGTKDGIAALSAQVCMDQADYYFTSPAFVGSSDARDQVGALMQAVFQKQMTVEEAFENAIKECEAGQA